MDKKEKDRMKEHDKKLENWTEADRDRMQKMLAPPAMMKRITKRDVLGREIRYSLGWLAILTEIKGMDKDVIPYLPFLFSEPDIIIENKKEKYCNYIKTTGNYTVGVSVNRKKENFKTFYTLDSFFISDVRDIEDRAVGNETMKGIPSEVTIYEKEGEV